MGTVLTIECCNNDEYVCRNVGLKSTVSETYKIVQNGIIQ